MNEWVKWMNHHPTKRVIKAKNQFIYAKNAFCVQRSLVLREHVNQNCTARLKKNRYRFFPMVTSSEAKRFGYGRENLFIFCFKVMMIKCQHVFMLTDSQCCWQYRALSISRKIQTAATHRWLSRDWLTCSCSLGFDNFIRCIKLSDWRLALARSQLLSLRLTWRRYLAIIDCLRNNFCTVYHFRVDDNHKACTRYELMKKTDPSEPTFFSVLYYVLCWPTEIKIKEIK